MVYQSRVITSHRPLIETQLENLLPLITVELSADIGRHDNDATPTTRQQ